MSTPTPRQVRDAVYHTFADEGRAPSIAELSERLGLSINSVEQSLRTLADEHALVLNKQGDAVRMAHPFTAAPMAFVVTPKDGLDDRRWWGGCAWDSFGISAALHLEVRIDTACPECGAHLSYFAGPDTPPPDGLAVRFPKPARQWWDDVVGTCTMIRMFCDDEHANRWGSTHARESGYVADAVAVWKLADPWYGDRLDPRFKPHSREHNQNLLAECGLRGDFWELP